ncbi:hypothetical protein HBH96_042400 [Parastagonospora nodorum]|nr:hypothetical protein HBH96_042400 [Parastagonospora nodorum]
MFRPAPASRICKIRAAPMCLGQSPLVISPEPEASNRLQIFNHNLRTLVLRLCSTVCIISITCFSSCLNKGSMRSPE